MKSYLLVGLILMTTFLAYGSSVEDSSGRLLDINQHHIANDLSLRVSNFGYLGSGSHSPQWPSLEFPANSGMDYLYQGSVWIGAKRIRRDEDGNKLFWEVWPPASENDVIAENSPGFDPDLHTVVVVDTLTSVGFDGDYSYLQLLPAYFPYEANYLPPDQYQNYNPLDVVVRSILGVPSLSDDTFPEDPGGYFDFFMTSPEQGDFPGMETMTSFYYDYSPFTPWGDPRHQDRKDGVSAGAFEHHPLYLSIRQGSYAWTYEELFDMIFFSFDIYNSNPLDTLYDVALAFFMDCDIGPQDWDGDAVSMNDLSGYYAGEGYEFAYTRDSDGDALHWAALKIFPYQNNDFACWHWTRGDGPDHRRPRRIPPLPGLITSNEKYWLMTGNNPNPDKFNPLRPENWQPGMEPHYEEPIPNDTRFLYTIYGDMQGFYDPSSQSINIPPGESITLHGVIFMGDDLDDLKDKSLIAEAFYDSGYDLALYEDEIFRPFLTYFGTDANSIELNWMIDEGADDLYLYYRMKQDPPIDWEIIELDTEIDSYILTDLLYDTYYEFFIAADHGDLYLESSTHRAKPTITAVEDGYQLPAGEGTRIVGNYPNPFNPDTRILFFIEEPSEVRLEIYNIRGQLVRVLTDRQYDRGIHSVAWNGLDSAQNEAASGVYFYRLKTENAQEIRKMLLLK